MSMQFTDAPYGLVVLAALLLAGLMTVCLAIRANGHHLDTAAFGRSYFWGYLLGFHLILHFGVLLVAFLLYGDMTKSASWAASLIGTAYMATGVGLILRLREGWMAGALLFAISWLLGDTHAPAGSLVFLAANALYAWRRWGEFRSLTHAAAGSPAQNTSQPLSQA